MNYLDPNARMMDDNDDGSLEDALEEYPADIEETTQGHPHEPAISKDLVITVDDILQNDDSGELVASRDYGEESLEALIALSIDEEHGDTSMREIASELDLPPDRTRDLVERV